MKKLFALLLAMLMVVSVFAGCGAKEEAPAEPAAPTETEKTDPAEEKEEAPAEAAKSDVTLTLAMCGDGTTKESLDNLLLGFTEETGIKVETVYINAGWGEYTTKIQTMIGGGEELDNCIVAVEGIPKFMNLGLTTSIEPWLQAHPDEAKALLENTNPSHQDSFKDADGNMHAIPFSYNNVVAHFNTARLAEAGLEVPAPDWTKDDFLDYCEKLTYEKDGVKNYAVCVPFIGDYFVLESWLYNNEAAYFNDDMTEVTINAPESVEVFQFLQDLIFKYGYAPIPEKSVNAISQLMSGQVAIGAWGRWPTANYVASDFHDVAIQYLPTFTVNQRIFGVDGIFTLATTKHPEEAMQLAIWMSSPEFASEYLSSGNIPANKVVAEAKIAELGMPDNCELFYEDLLNPEMKQVQCPINQDKAAAIIDTVLSELFVNNANVQETLDAAAEQLQALL